MENEKKDTLFDVAIRVLKNHPVIVSVLLAGLGLRFLTNGLTDISTIWSWMRPSKDQVFLACRWGVMPSAMAGGGHLNVLVVREQKDGGGGLVDFFGKPGADMTWGNDKSPKWAYQCEATNYSSDVLVHVSVTARLTFRASEPVPEQAASRRQGNVTLDRDWVFVIPKLDPSPAASFVFYLWNMSEPRFVQVAFRPVVTTSGGKTLPVVQPKDHLNQPLNPEPFLALDQLESGSDRPR